MNQDTKIKVIVGSKNPVKVEAVEVAFRKYWPGSEVVGIEVESGVAAQPMSEAETMNGARQRAYRALEIDESADYGVGIEGGVCDIEEKLFECAWVCVVKKSQIINDKLSNIEGVAGGLYFELPKKIASKIRNGGELGPIMEEIMKFDVKRTNGAIGVFSKDQLDRKSAYVQIVLSALIKFVSPEWFDVVA